MPRSRKLLLTTLVVGATSAVAGLGVFASFTATTKNSANSITAGSVSITDNDSNVALYSLTAAGPGPGTERCIRVTYAGTLPANVHLYTSPGITNGDKFHLKIERGSGLTAPLSTTNCTGFTASGVVWDSDLGGTIGFPTAYATAPDAGPAAVWAPNTVVDYKFTISVVDDTTANAHTTVLTSGTHDFTWEARNS